MSLTRMMEPRVCQVGWGDVQFQGVAYNAPSLDILAVPFRFRLSPVDYIEWINVVFLNRGDSALNLNPAFCRTSMMGVARKYRVQGILLFDSRISCFQPGDEHRFGFSLREAVEFAVRPDGVDGSELTLWSRDQGPWNVSWNDVQNGFWDPSGRDVPTQTRAKALADAVLVRVLDDSRLLSRLDADILERIVAEVFSREGFEVSLHVRTADGGVDVFAMSSAGLVWTSHVIQRKRYRGKVGVGVVRELYGVKTDLGANQAILVTTSAFTRPALDFAARHSWELSLVDGDRLLRWVRTAFANRPANTAMEPTAPVRS